MVRRWGGEGEEQEGAAWRESREESEPGAAATSCAGRGAVEDGTAGNSHSKAQTGRVGVVGKG